MTTPTEREALIERYTKLRHLRCNADVQELCTWAKNAFDMLAADACASKSKESDAQAGLSVTDARQREALEARSKIALECLPDAPYRAMLTQLHADMLAADAPKKSMAKCTCDPHVDLCAQCAPPSPDAQPNEVKNEQIRSEVDAVGRQQSEEIYSDSDLDCFRGDAAALVAAMVALLKLDAAGALVPHGIGGHARTLLQAAVARLAADDSEITSLRALLNYEYTGRKAQQVAVPQDDLVLLVWRLASSLKRAKPDSQIARDAINFINSKGLTPSPFRAAPQPPQQVAVPQITEAAIDEYLADYMLDDGDTRGHTPSEAERFLIKDAIIGLLAAAHQPPQAEQVPMTEAEIRSWWESENGLEDCDMCKLADFEKVIRAIEKRHGIKVNP